MIEKIYDTTKVFDYVLNEPAINLFIIGDIEQFGLNQEFQEVFLQYDEGEITACILRYYKNIVIYSDSNQFNASEIIDFINTFDYHFISGRSTVIEKIIPLIKKDKKVELCYFAKLNDSHQLKHGENTVLHANVNDLDHIIPLMKEVGFYSETYKQSNSARLKNHAGRIYYIEDNGLVVSSAATSIETSVSAMVGGVATYPQFRNKGLATEIVSKLCWDLLTENKTPCLFYSNPQAGHIYHKIGFKDIDKWTIIRF